MNLKNAIEFHKARRAQDHNAILTVVLKPVQSGAGSKQVLNNLNVGFNKNTSQM
jgi:hypothetical protein